MFFFFFFFFSWFFLIFFFFFYFSSLFFFFFLLFSSFSSFLTFFLSPPSFFQIVDRGHEPVNHGREWASQILMDIEEETEFIKAGADMIEAATGQRVWIFFFFFFFFFLLLFRVLCFSYLCHILSFVYI